MRSTRPSARSSGDCTSRASGWPRNWPRWPRRKGFRRFAPWFPGGGGGALRGEDAELFFFLFLDDDSRGNHHHQALGFPADPHVLEQPADVGELVEHRHAELVAALAQPLDAA